MILAKYFLDKNDCKIQIEIIIFFESRKEIGEKELIYFYVCLSFPNILNYFKIVKYLID